MGIYSDLLVYKKAFASAMKIFEITKKFPAEERFSLTDQIRRSSRSVCANLAESYSRKKYRAHFISKLHDAEAENTETEVWLDFSLQCKYISNEEHQSLLSQNTETGKLIWFMINNPEKFM